MLRSLGIAHRYLLSRFFTSRPIFLTHSVTSECNCRCKICDVWRKDRNGGEMSTREIFTMLDEARRLNFVSYVAWGGEPLMRPDIVDILRHATDLGLYTVMITNGYHLPEMAKDVAGAVDMTLVSIDHNSNRHDEMRCLDGTFDRAVEGTRRLRRAGARVAINCVISKLNADAVEEMGELARSLDVKLAFDPMEVFPGNNEEHALTPEESRRLFGEIAQLKKRGYGVLNSHEYLGHFANRLDYSCAQPKVFIRVSEDGKVQPFWCSKASMTLGDLRRQSLGEILDSNPFREFSEVASGCNSCVNSSTVEASIFYSARHFLMNPYSYLRFILDYAI